MPHNAPNPASAQFLGLAFVAGTLIAWTIAPLLIEYFTDDIDTWTSNGWRYGISALVWLPLLLWKAARGVWPKGLWRASLVPAALNILAQTCYVTAFYSIEPGLLTFGLRMQMIGVAIGAAILFPVERRVIKNPVFIIGMIALLAGVLATAGQTSNLAGATGWGVALAMIAGVAYAAYALSVRLCMKGFGAMESFAAIGQITAAGFLVLMLALGERAGLTALDHGLNWFGVLVFSAVLGIAAGHVLYYAAIERLGVAVSTSVIQLQPFTVTILSGVYFGERLAAGQWITGSIAIAGAMTMIYVQHRLAAADRRRAREFETLPIDPDVAVAANEPPPTNQPQTGERNT